MLRWAPARRATLRLMNPYAKFLGDRKPLEVIAEAPTILTQLVQQIGTGGMERPYGEGKWNARQILCHLADCELVFAFRLRQTLSQDHHVIQPFDQDSWATRYAQTPAEMARGVFCAMRHWNIALLRTIREEEINKPVTHPERGTMTFASILETMAGHDLNHRGQLETIAKNGQ